jgi:hypothetical protein
VASSPASAARPRTGLRERKKLAMRRRPASVALRLALDRGLENITIEDITAEALRPLLRRALEQLAAAFRTP